ncbi:hypothetical protein GPJ56_002912 [Histomonas meleagridis]|uniref:uncharacterized protein n=1 Tax=Histomonas meleagridis TaxID=135588 RepID=UPI003559A1B7|nr:hypothetical protein GPJ56_002912 [Histomonas meleagridis]KAH0800387.1 hypothetical protein GO595_006798 [Histomonas meleagridis]
MSRNDVRTTIQNENIESFNTDLVLQANLKLQSDDDNIQSEGLMEYINLLESPFEDQVMANGGREALAYFMGLSWNGCSERTQKLAIMCLSKVISDSYFDVEMVIRADFLHHLINNHLQGPPQFVNATTKLLSIVFSESSVAREIIYSTNIFDRLLQLPLECNTGELICLAVEHSDEPVPQIAQLAALMLQLLETDNFMNACYSLRCFSILISRNWNIFDFEKLHQILPRYLDCEILEVSTAAFLVLEQIPPNQNDINAVIDCMKYSNSHSHHALKYLKKSIMIWKDSPPSKLIEALQFLLEHSSFRIAQEALMLVIPALNGNSAKITPDLIKLICKFLSDTLTGKNAIATLRVIMNFMQTPENASLFKTIISEFEPEIEQFILDEDNEVANVAQELLDFMEI